MFDCPIVRLLETSPDFDSAVATLVVVISFPVRSAMEVDVYVALTPSILKIKLSTGVAPTDGVMARV
jgi:hypothetical protein